MNPIIEIAGQHLNLNGYYNPQGETGRAASLGWHTSSFSVMEPNKTYHQFEWMILFVLALVWIWQWEKRRRIKVLHKLSEIDPTINNNNARVKLKEIKLFTERLCFYRKSRGNTWRFLVSLPFIWTHMTIGAIIVFFAFSASPLGLFGGFIIIGISVFARWTIGLFG